MRKIRGIVPLGVAVAVVLAGCGGSSKSGGSGGTGGGGSQAVAAADLTKPGPDKGWSSGGLSVQTSTLACNGAAPDPTRGVTDTTVKIGGLAYLTSASGSSMAGSAEGAKARFERANAAGGVAGRKIDFTGVLDDGLDPSRTGAQADVLVNQQKVFAVAPLLTAFPNYLDTFCRQKVPFFGWGFNSGYCGTTIGFGITGCLVPTKETAALPYVNASAGVLARQVLGGDPKGKTLALVGEDNDSSRTGINTLARAFTTAGVKVVYKQASVPQTGLNDPTPIVAAIMRSNNGQPPDMVYHTISFQNGLKLTAALKAAGYKGKQINPTAYDPRLTGAKDLYGSYISLQWTPGVATNVPAIQQMVADFKKYAPSTVLSLPAMAGYWSADFVVSALTKTGRNLTVDSFLKTLNGGSFAEYQQGALAESRWPLNHVTGVPCTGTALLDSGKYTQIGSLVCGQIVKVK